MKKTFVSFALVIAGVFHASLAHATFLPPNHLDKFDRLNSRDANIDEKQFNAIIDRVLSYYQPIAANHNAKLQATRKWTDSTVNANSNQTGSNWFVNMYGGLARRPELTQDGFMMVVCHEVGHHLGGFPFYPGWRTTWAADEGQADTFAAQTCLRQMWENEVDENAKAAATVDPTAKLGCEKVWKTANEQNLCFRVANASHSLAKLLAMLGSSSTPKEIPSFDKPDPSVVQTTFDDHPAAQCRLDTYFAGALCAASFDTKTIPGRDNPDGQDSIAAEKQASENSCMKASGYSIGLRPRCWFAPRM